MADHLRIFLAAKEIYTGEINVELPFGIDEDDVEYVLPEGYGYAEVNLTKSGQDKLKGGMAAVGAEISERPDWCTYSDTIFHIGDEGARQMVWVRAEHTVSPDKEIKLSLCYEADMEFCETEENVIDEWEVTNGET